MTTEGRDQPFILETSKRRIKDFKSDSSRLTVIMLFCLNTFIYFVCWVNCSYFKTHVPFHPTILPGAEMTICALCPLTPYLILPWNL